MCVVVTARRLVLFFGCTQPHTHTHRVVDPESEGKLAQSDHNLELQALKDYLCDRGRGYAGFRQPSAVYIME